MVVCPDSNSDLFEYLTLNSNIQSSEGGILTYPIVDPSPGLQANSYYFGHPEWAKNYLKYCHRSKAFKARWRAAIRKYAEGGVWDEKVVVDIGCEPGNLYASLGGEPRMLIGVDVSHGALEMAQQIGYTPLLADAHNLPFISNFADIVTVNATLHHCDNMAQVLAESARLVRPGGILITDHDPQYSAYNFKGLGLFLWNLRVPLYRMLKRGGHTTKEEQTWMLATEIHHNPGDGVTPELFYRTLEPLGFAVKLYPHNNKIGAEALQNQIGSSVWKCRLNQRLSGINSNLPEAAISLICVAKRIGTS